MLPLLVLHCDWYSRHHGQHCTAKNSEGIQVCLVMSSWFKFVSSSVDREVVKSKEIAESGVQLELVSLNLLLFAGIYVDQTSAHLQLKRTNITFHNELLLRLPFNRWQMTWLSWQASWQALLTPLMQGESLNWRSKFQTHTPLTLPRWAQYPDLSCTPCISNDLSRYDLSPKSGIQTCQV